AERVVDARRSDGQLAVPGIANDAHHREPRLVHCIRETKLEPLADGVLSGPEAAHRRLADDRYGERPRAVPVRECAAATERHAHGLEIVGSDGLEVERWVVDRCGLPLPFRADSRIPATGADEWGEDDRSGRGTRRRLEPLDELEPTTAKTSTRASTRTSARRGSCGGATATSPRTAPYASPIPRAPPPAARTPVSTSSCRAILPEPAPSAVRTASSRCRVTPRISNREATFTPAITRTNPTAPERMSTESRRPPISTSRNGST